MVCYDFNLVINFTSWRGLMINLQLYNNNNNNNNNNPNHTTDTYKKITQIGKVVFENIKSTCDGPECYQI